MCFAMLFMYVSAALAQTKISGTVVAADDNEPVIGATIMVVGTKSGAVTDVDGKFSLTTDVANPQITVGYIGMASQTLKYYRHEGGAKVKHSDTERGCCDGSYPHRPSFVYGCYRQG